MHQNENQKITLPLVVKFMHYFHSFPSGTKSLNIRNHVKNKMAKLGKNCAKLLAYL